MNQRYHTHKLYFVCTLSKSNRKYRKSIAENDFFLVLCWLLFLRTFYFPAIRKKNYHLTPTTCRYLSYPVQSVLFKDLLVAKTWVYVVAFLDPVYIIFLVISCIDNLYREYCDYSGGCISIVYNANRLLLSS